MPPSATAFRAPLLRRAAWLACLWPLAGLAAEPPSEQPLPGAPEFREQPPQGPAEQPPAPEQGGLWQRDRLLGDLGGLRSRLEDAGFTLGLQEQSEVLGNVSGGVRQGAVYDGATLMGLAVDLEKAIGLPGGKINASAYQIHGRGLSANNLRNLNVVSGIEATRSTRLFELWYEQTVLDGKLSVRIGQQAADQEFLISQYGAVFINAAFGWPMIPTFDLPSGGPAYPLGTPGVRFKVLPGGPLTFLAGVYNGDPAPAGLGDPQRRDASGTAFRLNGGVFAIVELQYGVNAGDEATGLPGIYKIGGWYNSNNFADQRFAFDRRSLADPSAAGVPLLHRNDWSVYAVADQLIYRSPGTKDGGAGAFVRIMGAPGDRSLLNFFLNAGVTYKGLLPGRENDTAGLGFAYARVSDTASKFDSDIAFFSGAFHPIRRSETVLELTYQYQVAPWWSVQPDFQYVFNPGGGVPNPNNASHPIGDAAVLGLRTTLVF